MIYYQKQDRKTLILYFNSDERVAEHSPVLSLISLKVQQYPPE